MNALVATDTRLDHKNLETANANAAVIDAESTKLSGMIHANSRRETPVLFVDFITIHLGYAKH